LTGLGLPVGDYTVLAIGYTQVGAIRTTVAQTAESLLVVAQAPERFTPAVPAFPSSGYPFPASPEAIAEVALLDGLYEGFCPFYFNSTLLSPLPSPPVHAVRCPALVGPHVGRVFPDVQGALNDELPLMLAIEPDPDYPGSMRTSFLDVLVVGSNVDHTAMSKPASQEAVKAWVLAGGHLVVMGSTAQEVAWLAPIFQAGISASSGGMFVPDSDHPLLRVPYDLPIDDYAAATSAWTLDAEFRPYFTSVVGDALGNDLLAVSNPGAFGSGRIVLSGWTPHQILPLGDPAQDTEARHLLVNLVLIGYQDLFLDYGPPLPDGQSVVPATRLVIIDHPDLGPVPVNLVVYVFRS
jgi:hypothetical protein